VTLFRQRFAKLSTNWLLEGYDVVICQGCGFGFADNIPDQATFDRFYRDVSRYEYHHLGGNEPDWVHDRLKETADWVQSLVESKSARIADVGCATGGMVKVLLDRGFEHAIGYDPSPGCAEAARRLYGVEVRTRSLSNLCEETDRFDLIMLMGVVEHLCDLGPAISTISARLVDGGLALIGVPDATQFSKWPNAPFQEFSTEHIGFFSPGSMENLMGRHGLAQVSTMPLRAELSRQAVEPSFVSVFRKTPAFRRQPVREADTERGLRDYIAKSQALASHVEQVLERIHQAGKPVIVWGVGTHTLSLLELGKLGDLKIAAFVDSNPKFSGTLLRGVPVLAPEQVRGRPEPILISSWIYQVEIQHLIKDVLGLPNEVIRMYDL